MHPLKIISSAVILLSNTAISTAQTVEGYYFENYKPQKAHTTKKARLNYASNRTAREFRTIITASYKSGKIDFAGHFITATWGCGTGCMSGAMVDVLDGKVYDLPVGEMTYFYGCDLGDEDCCANFNAESRLFITVYCTESDENFEKTYFINAWDDTKKKFVLLEKSEKIVPKTK